MSPLHPAPILVVGYNRPQHLRKVIESLAKNPESAASDLYLMIDGPRNEMDHRASEQIIEYVETIRSCFQTVTLTIREQNLGLSTNVTRSINEVLAKYESVIVLEDDLVTAPSFLAYMNAALDYYVEEKRVWHIAAYSLLDDTTQPDAVFLMRQMVCWGWATWRDRWLNYRKDPAALVSSFSSGEIFDFTLRGTTPSWEQVLDNAANRIDTWAVFWNATIFRNNGLCVNPFLSYVQNIGFDFSGTNTFGAPKPQDCFKSLNHHGHFTPEDNIEENSRIMPLIESYFRSNFPKRPYRRRLKIFLSRFLSQSQLKRLRTLVRL